MDSARNTHASCLNTVSHTRRREITRGRSRRSARASVFMFSLNNGIKPSFKALSFSLFYYFFFSRSLLFHGTFVLHTPVSRLAVVETRRVAPPTHTHTHTTAYNFSPALSTLRKNCPFFINRAQSFRRFRPTTIHNRYRSSLAISRK